MTSTFRLFFFLCIALPLVPAARADVAAVHRDKLPQSITTLGAYDDLIQIEHCVDRYSETWQCNLDRQKVVDRLFEDFEFLVSSLRVNPDNRELRLLTLLAAHYAYNVDIDMSYEGFKSAYQPLSQAHDDDIRPRWFLADFQCQANDIEEGMNGFLNMEKSLPANALPARFWHDYTSCATMTVMPAHALHAIESCRDRRGGQVGEPVRTLRHRQVGQGGPPTLIQAVGDLDSIHDVGIALNRQQQRPLEAGNNRVRGPRRPVSQERERAQGKANNQCGGLHNMHNQPGRRPYRAGSESGSMPREGLTRLSV